MSTERFITEFMLTKVDGKDATSTAAAIGALGVLGAGAMVIETYLPTMRPAAYGVLLVVAGAAVIESPLTERAKPRGKVMRARKTTSGDDDATL